MPQPAPYAPPYPVVDESSQRSLASERLTSSPHGRSHQSPSLSEESQHVDGNLDAQIEPELVHSQNNVPAGQNREPGGTSDVWSERESSHEVNDREVGTVTVKGYD
jgi:hypothetical protein